MAENKFREIAGIAALALCLAGCASSSDRYPSLAKSDVERITGVFEPVAPTSQIIEPTSAPADEAARLQELVAQASASHEAFLAAIPGTEELIGQIDEKGPESASWAEAQIALSQLDSQRSQTAIVLGDLDLLYANASVEFVERQAIAEAREAVLASIREEDAVLVALRRQAN